jgi:hypothetical protein
MNRRKNSQNNRAWLTAELGLKGVACAGSGEARLQLLLRRVPADEMQFVARLCRSASQPQEMNVAPCDAVAEQSVANESDALGGTG